MNKKAKYIYCGLLTAMVFGIGVNHVSLSAANVSPGSSADPLVSKSYVDEKISELLGVLSTSGGYNTGDSANSASQTNADTYTPVSAQSGQIILGGEGTEIILRSGSAVGYCEGENGIANVTIGADIGNGTIVGKNNLLIVPRNDGRGVKVSGNGEAWFLIKGSYEIR